MLVGATAYRMLMGWAPNQVKARRRARLGAAPAGSAARRSRSSGPCGGIPIAVIPPRHVTSASTSAPLAPSTASKLRALGRDARLEGSTRAYGAWPHARAFAAIWEVVGERKNPSIVSRAPRRGSYCPPPSSSATSAAWSLQSAPAPLGYSAVADLRYLCGCARKRLQGSHFANRRAGEGVFNDMVIASARSTPAPSQTRRLSPTSLAPPPGSCVREPPPASATLACLVGAPASALGRGRQALPSPPATQSGALPPPPRPEAHVAGTR